MAESRDATRTDGSGTTVVEATGIEKTYGSRLPFSRSVEVLDGATIVE